MINNPTPACSWQLVPNLWQWTLLRKNFATHLTQVSSRMQILWGFQRENQFCNGSERKKKLVSFSHQPAQHKPFSSILLKVFLLKYAQRFFSLILLKGLSPQSFLGKEQTRIVNPFQCCCLNCWVWYCYCQGILVTLHNINVNSSDCANPFSSCSKIFQRKTLISSRQLSQGGCLCSQSQCFRRLNFLQQTVSFETSWNFEAFEFSICDKNITFCF